MLVLAALASVGPGAQAPGWTTYRDPAGRFAFEYPQQFGTPGRGTNDGFADRVAAVRFATVPGLGGEVALIRGRVVLDIQALGGLYDPITLEVFPDATRRQVVAVLPAVTRDNVCDLMAASDHVRNAAGLAPPAREAARGVDRMRHVDPRVVRCESSDDIVVFHEEVTFETPGASARQHIFGALRFLDPPYSAVQFVRGLPTPPSTEDLEASVRIVRSFTP